MEVKTPAVLVVLAVLLALQHSKPTGAAAQPTPAAHVPLYMRDAKAFVSLFAGAAPGVNTYGADNKQLSVAAARTQCASFVTMLWNYTYASNWSASVNMTAWMGSASPFAEDYHDAIKNETGWKRITVVDELLEGDVIAMRYGQDTSNLTVTGHVMLFVNSTMRAPATAPLVANTIQYDVWVIDSSSSYHGPHDTRAPPAGTPGGIGSGVVRLYVDDATNAIVGYTWSTESGSEYYGSSEGPRTIVAGRPEYLLQRVEPTHYGGPDGGAPPPPHGEGSGSASWDGSQQILIPAYFYPGAIWDRMLAAADNIAQIGIVIANPNSGPGSSYDANYGQYINATRAKGISVIGYIHVSYGARALNLVSADIAAWRSMYNITGFFVDETPTTATESDWANYWGPLNRTIRAAEAESSSYIVINPGTIPDEKFTNISDTIVVHETFNSQAATWSPPAWAASYSPTKFCVLYHEAPNVTAMNATVQLAKRNRVHYVYVTDDLMPNPWDLLPSYYETELAELARPSVTFTLPPIQTAPVTSTTAAPTVSTTTAPQTTSTPPVATTTATAAATATAAPLQTTNVPAASNSTVAVTATPTPTTVNGTNGTTTLAPAATNATDGNGTTGTPQPTQAMRVVRKRLRLSGAHWVVILQRVSQAELRAAVAADIAGVLRVPASRIVIVAFSIGSLVTEYDLSKPVAAGTPTDNDDDVALVTSMSAAAFNTTLSVYRGAAIAANLTLNSSDTQLFVLDAQTLATPSPFVPSTPRPPTPQPSTTPSPPSPPGDDEASPSACGRGCVVLIVVVAAVVVIGGAVAALVILRPRIASTGTKAPPIAHDANNNPYAVAQQPYHPHPQHQANVSYA